MFRFLPPLSAMSYPQRLAGWVGKNSTAQSCSTFLRECPESPNDNSGAAKRDFGKARSMDADVPADGGNPAIRSSGKRFVYSSPHAGLGTSYVGEEAIAVGVCETLERSDYITS